ncbi:SDR family oxidoreductase [Arthrobacter sp. NPDC080031]|uniref:SDR family oxidoreductase n=1 Tax=Arthrobacter sp. NPDC080031 TaxID=3155918 RepID=UPI00345065F1
MTDSKKTALVVGATGVVGRSLLKQLVADPEWDVIAVSRRTPEVEGDYRHLAINLLDAEATRNALNSCENVNHVFFSAYIQKPTWAEMVEPNMAMLRNLMDGIEPVAKNLQHVNLMHGTKWYGNHLGEFKTPAQETDPRHMPPNFYYDQQDYIVERQQGASWTWSAARPHGICGLSIGNPMNLVMVLAVYATVSKALGLPLRHPGSVENSRALYNVTDGKLLANACTWMATDPSAANEAYNITNGDAFRWQDMWPIIADYFGMETAQAQQIDLVQMMADKAPLWEKLSAERGLMKIPYEQLVDWSYGNFVFTPQYDVMSSTTKARRAGFTGVDDSAEMFLRHFDELRANRIIP